VALLVFGPKDPPAAVFAMPLCKHSLIRKRTGNKYLGEVLMRKQLAMAVILAFALSGSGFAAEHGRRGFDHGSEQSRIFHNHGYRGDHDEIEIGLDMTEIETGIETMIGIVIAHFSLPDVSAMTGIAGIGSVGDVGGNRV
jgi:hypothetical protein